MSLTVLPRKGDYFHLSVWIFVIAWLVGNVAMMAGLEAVEGFLQNTLALGILALACCAWWWAYKLSNFRNRAGFAVIAIWSIGPIIALFDLQKYIRSLFFWGSVVLLSLLVALALWVEPRHEVAERTPSK